MTARRGRASRPGGGNSEAPADSPEGAADLFGHLDRNPATEPAESLASAAVSDSAGSTAPAKSAGAAETSGAAPDSAATTGQVSSPPGKGARLMTLKVRGFRAFGTEARILQADEPLVVLHAGNSQGKTSMAEAIEFLISGRSSRRELLGGAKAEYDGSLRNAHLAAGDDTVYVQAVVRDPSGTPRTVRRELLSDFGRGTECASRLTVDGTDVDDLSEVGIRLADGPVRAPVLLQHILRHVLSTEPKQRVGYFKALLELTDLDQLRERVKLLRGRVEAEQPGAALRYATTLTGPVFAIMTAQLRTAVNRSTTMGAATALVDQAIFEAGRAVLTGGTATPPEGADTPDATADGPRDLLELHSALKGARDEQRERSFPMTAFMPGPAPSPPPRLPDLSTYDAALAVADDSAARLTPVIEALLNIDTYAALADPDSAPLDCPICGTQHALDPARAALLRQHLLDTRAIDDAAREAARALNATADELDRAETSLARSVPAVAAWDEPALARAASRLTELGLDTVLLNDVHAASRAIATAAERALEGITADRRRVTGALIVVAAREPLPSSYPQPKQPATAVTPDAPTEPNAVAPATGPGASSADGHDATADSTRTTEAYATALGRLRAATDAAGRTQNATPGLAEVTELLARRSDLAADLVAESARQRTIKRITAAERALREAAGKVLDARFEQMSDTITAWWRSIRPEELVDFGGVKRRAGGALFVNLVAALRTDLSSDPVEREALGVYSDSQLNALGLSIFLARTQLLDSPIVVLDDPIPGSDADHRTTFVENTLGQLLDSGVQVVLSTFDGKLVQHARAIHDWRGLSAYDLTLLDAVSGTEVTQTSDTFSQLLLEAEDNLHSPTARSRRAACNSLRSAAERLAKQIIATGRTHDGHPTGVADVHDEASVLGKLVPLVSGYALDGAEKGQWRSFNSQLNPGSHDDDVPSTISLKQVRSNLRKIAKNHREHWPGGLVL